MEPTRVPFVVVLPDKPAELAERETVPAPQRTILAAELVCGAKQGACSMRTWFNCQHRPNDDIAEACEDESIHVEEEDYAMELL